MNGLANYFFLPALRQGLATVISQPATAHRVALDVQLHTRAITEDGSEDSEVVAKSVQLFGPGDILGFDSRIVARADPRPGVGDFEPNYFPAIEFADPDFVWRYTAAVHDTKGNLTPWITLVVLVAEDRPDESQPNGVKEKEYSVGDRTSGAKLSWINVNTNYLPDLSEAWRWAHTQITTDSNLADGSFNLAEIKDQLKAIVHAQPERTVSRLVCARRLRPKTLYHAFVVPTFKLGRYAGRGLTPPDDTNALTLSWDAGSNELIELPYYYKWEFRTGERGDFEQLVRLLEPRKLSDLGTRTMNCGSPGYSLPGVIRTDLDTDHPDSNTLGLEGALMAVDAVLTPWGKDGDGEPSDFRATLADSLLNKPKADLKRARRNPPVVAPPIYGRWHAARTEIRPRNSDDIHIDEIWIDDLNLDPRHRVAAGIGARVIQKQQEPLMASAWKQLGDVEQANDLLRRAQLGRESMANIFSRLSSLALGDAIRVMSPLNARVRIAARTARTEVEKTTEDLISGSTAQEQIRNSRVPEAALDPTFRRIRRSRGPVAKRQKFRIVAERRDILEQFNSGQVRAAGPHPSPHGMVTPSDVTIKIIEKHAAPKQPQPPPVVFSDSKKRRSIMVGTGGIIGRVKELMGGIELSQQEISKLFVEQSVTCESIESGLAESTISSPDAGTTGAVICDALQGLSGDEPPSELKIRLAGSVPLDLGELRTSIQSALDPRDTILIRTKKRLRFRETPEQADPLDIIMAAPEFPQPMYEPLRDESQDLLLPGIENVPPNTVGLLNTNKRFVESYMCGCNHGFAGELLWREYPTDQRGSYFRQFWDVSGYVPSDAEVSALRAEAETVVESGGDDREKRIRLEMQRLLRNRLRDIKPINEWGTSELGKNHVRIVEETEGENLVLVIRGDLLKKYPNATIYAVPAQIKDGRRVPALPEFLWDPNSSEPVEPVSAPKYPLFSGELPPDVTFVGFGLTAEEACGSGDFDGWYFVIEERISEARFGLDVPDDSGSDIPTTWDGLNWNHMQSINIDDYINGAVPVSPADTQGKAWNTSSTTSADIACITLQKPVRIVLHARKMMPEGVCQSSG